MQLVYRTVLQWGVTLKLYKALYSQSLNPTPHISRRSSVGSALGLESKVCWFEPTVRHYFSSNNVRQLAYTSLHVKIHNQNEWSVTNQIEYTGFRQNLIFSLFVSCFYRKGPALTLMGDIFKEILFARGNFFRNVVFIAKISPARK